MAKTKVIGTVESTSNQTVGVSFVYKTRHPKYQKIIKKTQKFLAHDPEGICKIGDTVEIEESRKVSKNKNFKVIRVI